MDRVHFSVNLYRGEFRESDEPDPDFSYGVIVECQRVRGDTISFHHACRAILNAAMGFSDGVDQRRWRSPTEVPSEQTRPTLSRAARASCTSAGLTGLENALGLLKKDRIDAQRLGLESLVMLADENTAGKDLSAYCSLAVLGTSPSESTAGVHTWIVSLLEERMAPGETVVPFSVLVESSGVASIVDESAASTADATVPEIEDTYHGGILRTLALRTFANALAVLARHESEMLRLILSEHSEQLVSKSFLEALVDDLAGASRPPAVVAGTRLASPHEAALAASCLRILAEHSDKAAAFLTSSDQVLASLSRAGEAGRASHAMLANESELTLAVLEQIQDRREEISTGISV